MGNCMPENQHYHDPSIEPIIYYIPELKDDSCI